MPQANVLLNSNPRNPIKIERAGRRVLPSSPLHSGFWQLTLDGTVIGWATSHEAAEAKARRLERARQAR